MVDKIRRNSLEKKLGTETVTLCAPEDVLTFTITSADGESKEFYYDENGNLTSAKHNGEEVMADKINLQFLNNQISEFCTFACEKSFKNENADSDYGLSPDWYTVTIKTRAGAMEVLHLGKETGDGSGIYIRRNSEEKILLGSRYIAAAVAKTFDCYMNLYVVNIMKITVEEITFTRTSTGDKIVVEPAEDDNSGIYTVSNYKVTYPMKRDASSTLVQLLDKVLFFQISSYFPIDEADYPSYGLDEPEYIFSIKQISGNVTELRLSREIGGFYYGTATGVPYVFRVTASSITGLNLSSFELIDAYVIHEYLDEIRTVRVEMNDTQFIFDIYIDSTKTITSEDSYLKLDQRDAKVFAPDGSSYALLLYTSIFQMRASAVDYDADPKLENVECTITVTTTLNRVYSLKLVPRDETTYYCFIDDRYSGFIVDRSVLYKDNGHVFSDFGIWDAYQLLDEAIMNKDDRGIYERP